MGGGRVDEDWAVGELDFLIDVDFSDLQSPLVSHRRAAIKSDSKISLGKRGWHGCGACCLTNRAHRKLPDWAAWLHNKWETVAAWFVVAGLIALAGRPKRSEGATARATLSLCSSA